MSTLTPILKLNVPAFDEIPWDEEVNNNWTVLDAVVGQFSSLPNMVGVWKNSVNYVYGQTVVDATDASIWNCIQTHTSSAAPTTFAAERSAFPARWSLSQPGASYWASQAASSASAAAASAAAAAASAATVAGALPLSGGTMTGRVTLSADPVNALHAATKQYVDARVGGTGFLPLTGGTLTGTLEVGGNGVAYTNQGANKAAISFGWTTGSKIPIIVQGSNVGNVATEGYVSGAYLPLTGGNVTGLINSTNEFRGTAFRLPLSGAALTTDATYTHVTFDSSNTKLRYTRSNGVLEYLNAVGTQLLYCDGVGNFHATGQIASASLVSAATSMFANGGTYYCGPANDASFSTNGSSYTKLLMQGNYGWDFDWAFGNLVWRRWDNAAAFQIRISDAMAGHDNGPVYGNGAYVNISDERVKQNIAPVKAGLHEVLQLSPIAYARIASPARTEVGFSAQQVQLVLPHAVRLVGDDGLLGVMDEPIVAALVNSVKTLHARISTLEASSGTATH